MRANAVLPEAYSASPLGYGCMRITGRATAGREAVIAAYEAGIRLFDHADIYSGGACEELFGEILREVPGMREEIVLQTKAGIRFPDGEAPARYDFSREHLLGAVEGSLRRLGVDHVDVLLLHRIDLLADPDEVAAVFEELVASGKVAHVGLSNASPSQYRMLASRSRYPLVANQVEINLDRIDAFVDGTLDQCLELGISPQAWCPIAGLGYRAWGGHAEPAQWTLVEQELERQADCYASDRVGIALAWLLRHPARIVPLIGTTRPERVRSALQAAELSYTREDWYRLYQARRGQRVP